MTISEKFQNLAVAESETYSAELNNYIHIHNKAISDFAQSITMATTVSLLIKKGIISDEEFTNELDAQINENAFNFKTIEENKNILLEVIECENEHNQSLKEMHDAMVNQSGTEMTLTASGGINIDSEEEVGVNTTCAEADCVSSFIE